MDAMSERELSVAMRGVTFDICDFQSRLLPLAFVLAGGIACSSVGDTAVRAKSDGNTADLDGAIGAGELDGADSDVVDVSYDGNGLWETDAGDGKPWYEKKLGTIFPSEELSTYAMACGSTNSQWIENNALQSLDNARIPVQPGEPSYEEPIELTPSGIVLSKDKPTEFGDFIVPPYGGDRVYVARANGVRFEFRTLVKKEDAADCSKPPAIPGWPVPCPRVPVLLAFHDDGTVRVRPLDMPNGKNFDFSWHTAKFVHVDGDAIGLAITYHAAPSDKILAYAGYDADLNLTRWREVVTLPDKTSAGEVTKFSSGSSQPNACCASDGEWVSAFVRYDVLGADQKKLRTTGAIVSVRPADGATRHFEIGQNVDIELDTVRFVSPNDKPDSVPHARVSFVAHWPRTEPDDPPWNLAGEEDALVVANLPAGATPTFTAWLPLQASRPIAVFQRGTSMLFVMDQSTDGPPLYQLLAVGPHGGIVRHSTVPALAARPDLAALCSVRALENRLVWVWRAATGQKAQPDATAQLRATWTDLWGWETAETSGACQALDDSTCVPDSVCEVVTCSASTGCLSLPVGKQPPLTCGVAKKCGSTSNSWSTSECLLDSDPKRPWLVLGGPLGTATP